MLPFGINERKSKQLVIQAGLINIKFWYNNVSNKLAGLPAKYTGGP
jgi:hypothetical protein